MSPVWMNWRSRRGAWFAVTALIVFLLTFLVLVTFRVLMSRMAQTAGVADVTRAQALAESGLAEAVELAFGMDTLADDLAGAMLNPLNYLTWSKSANSALTLAEGESLRFNFTLARDRDDLDKDTDVTEFFRYDPSIGLDGMDNADALIGKLDAIPDNESPLLLPCEVCAVRGLPVIEVRVEARAAGATRRLVAWISADWLDLVRPEWDDTLIEDNVMAALFSSVPLQADGLFIDATDHHPNLDLGWGDESGEVDTTLAGSMRRLYNGTISQDSKEHALLPLDDSEAWHSLVHMQIEGVTPLEYSGTRIQLDSADPYHAAGRFRNQKSEDDISSIGYTFYAPDFSEWTGFMVADATGKPLYEDRRSHRRFLAGADVTWAEWEAGAAPAGFIHLQSPDGSEVVLDASRSQPQRPSLLLIEGNAVIKEGWQWKGFVMINGNLIVEGGNAVILGALVLNAPAGSHPDLDGLRILASHSIISRVALLNALPVVLGRWDARR